MSSTLKLPVNESDHAAGPADAPITLVEYGDFQCPHCARAHHRLTAIQQRFGDRLRLVFRNFPLAEVHPEAFHAAEAAESVGASVGNDAYWKMHDLLFEHQQDDLDALDDAHLAHYAQQAGGDPAAVSRDLENSAFVEKVRADFMGGVRSGVNGTPTFFINGVRYDGDWGTIATFASDLERAIR
jgi:Protein-disulfide isomerase